MICLAGLVGCGDQAPPPTAAVPSARAKTANRGGDTGAKQEGEPGGSAGDDDAPAEGDTEWQACYLHGEKIGYAAITTRHVDGPGRSQLEIASRNHMSIRRFGNQNTIDVETTSLETAAGDVLAFRSVTVAGDSRMTVAGKRAGSEMEIETTVADMLSTRRMPWRDDFRGFHAVEQSLERQPLRPGQTRTLKQLHPMLTQVIVADVTLVAHDVEETKLLDGSARLLHIDVATVLPGRGAGGQAPTVHSIVWTDDAGRTIKMTTEAAEGLEETNYRTTQKIAKAAAGDAQFDLGFDPIVKIAKPLPEPWKTRRVRYRVELAGGDPANLFPVGLHQQVKSIDPHTVEIIETAPGAVPTGKSPTGKVPAGKVPAAAQPTPQESAASSMIQSADPTIVAMASEARGSKQEPLAVAYALEKYVHDVVENKDFSQAFASALEVARSRQGDCTEHAVLLAALARASGMPARVAIGLVYVPQQQGFGYHMWTEVFVGNRWLPLDATLGHGGIGASHLKLGELDLADSDANGGSALASLLSVMQVLGRLKISVLEVE